MRHHAMLESLLCYHALPPSALPLLCASADGRAILALLANSAAKAEPDYYWLKAPLVTAACRAAGRQRSWVDAHAYRRVGSGFDPHWQAVYYVETTIPAPSGDTWQLAFHFPAAAVLPRLRRWPRANGRHWRGQHAQAAARTIALSYLEDKIYAVR